MVFVVGGRTQSLRQHGAGAADPGTSPRRSVPKQQNAMSCDTRAHLKEDSKPDGRASGDNPHPARFTGSGANVSSSKAVHHNGGSVPQFKKPVTEGAPIRAPNSQFGSGGLPSPLASSSVSSNTWDAGKMKKPSGDFSDDDAFASPGGIGLGGAAAMDISTISKLILTASSSTGSEDLADFIMRVSKSSSSSTERDGSTSSQEPRKRAPLINDQASSVPKELPPTAGGGKVDRQPDGKSQIGNKQKVHSVKLTSDEPRSNSVHSVNKVSSGSFDNVPSRVRSVDSSLTSTNDDRESLRRKSAEGKADEDSNKKFKGSRIPTFGGKKHPKINSGSERLVTCSSNDLDTSLQRDDKAKESKKDVKLPVGKVEPMLSSERDDANMDMLRWKSPRRSSMMPRTTREDETTAMARRDLSVLSEANQDVRIVDGLSASQPRAITGTIRACTYCSCVTERRMRRQFAI